MSLTRTLAIAAAASTVGVAVMALDLSTDGSGTSAPPSDLVETAGTPDEVSYRPGAKACLAEAVYYETRGTSLKAGQAVAHVVLNRRAHDEFPQSVCAVVEDGCQFSYQCDGKPEDLADAAERERAFRVAETVLEGDVTDPTDGALYFRSEGAASEDWFETLDRTVEIGGNIFYR